MSQVRVLFPVIVIFILVSRLDSTPNLEIIHRLKVAPGNITLSPENRLFISLQAFYNPEFKVVEVLEDSSIKPYPAKSWNTGVKGPMVFGKVFGVQVDPDGILWILDGGIPGNHQPRLLGWNTREESLFQSISLPALITLDNSFLNDLAVDFLRKKVYITDTARGHDSALIVVDLKKATARRILQSHPSLTPKNLELLIEEKPLRKRLPDGNIITPRLGANPIVLDTKNEWLYFGPMHSHSIYRIRAEDLANENLNNYQLYSRIERYGYKPICDGISIDAGGNLYFSHLSENGVGMLSPDRTYQLLLRDSVLLSWPNAFSFGSDGFLYTVSSQIHRSAVLNAGENLARPPFHILRFKPMLKGITGR